MSLGKHKVCIKVPKVYDWVQRQVEVPLLSFEGEKLDDIFDLNGNYEYDTELCEILADTDYTVHCHLIEDSILCKEIKQHPTRHDVDVTLPTGETITLQKVKVLLKGKVQVVIDIQNPGPNCKKHKIVSEPINFQTVQTFFLCAPEGTDLKCKVTYFQCDADVICELDPHFEQLDVSILLCLDVQMETDVKLEVEAAICKPRQELPIEDIVCPTDIFPPQCPEIFPAHHGKKC